MIYQKRMKKNIINAYIANDNSNGQIVLSGT